MSLRELFWPISQLPKCWNATITMGRGVKGAGILLTKRIKLGFKLHDCGKHAAASFREKNEEICSYVVLLR
jgi:hypothetical protein